MDDKNLRGFFDPEKLRSWVFSNTKEAFNNKLNKIETNDHELQVKDLHIKNEDKHPTAKELHQAVLDKKDLGLSLVGTFQLIDKKTRKVTDEKTVTVAQIPNITFRNTAVYNGTEYVPIQQSRLKPGAYTRVQENGLVAGQLNPANGMQMHIIFNPQTGIFFLQLGTVNLSLYSILRDMDIADSEIEKYWGKELLTKNKLTYKTDQIDKLYGKLFKYD